MDGGTRTGEDGIPAANSANFLVHGFSIEPETPQGWKKLRDYEKEKKRREEEEEKS